MKKFLKDRCRRANDKDSDLDNVKEEILRETKTMAEIKFEAILFAYEANNNNAQAACRELRISKATFYREMQKYNYRLVRNIEKKEEG